MFNGDTNGFGVPLLQETPRKSLAQKEQELVWIIKMTIQICLCVGLLYLDDLEGKKGELFEMHWIQYNWEQKLSNEANMEMQQKQTCGFPRLSIYIRHPVCFIEIFHSPKTIPTWLNKLPVPIGSIYGIRYIC